MRISRWYSSRDVREKAAIISGVCAVVAAIVAAIATSAFALFNTQPGGSGAQSPPAAAPTSSGCSAKLLITSPAENASISNGSNGVVIAGTACELGGDSGWLFDYDPEDGYLYDDYSGNSPAPVVPAGQNGSWEFQDNPIGDQGDLHKLYSLKLVLASPSCASVLLAAPRVAGDYKIKALPAGCSVTQNFSLYVTYP